MSWVFRHKFVMLIIITGTIYLFMNPSHGFGIVHKGFIVYNRIPIFGLDCYIDPNGGLHLESDLRVASNLKYWLEQHFLSYIPKNGDFIPLLIGTGFGDSAAITFDYTILSKCRERRFNPTFHTTPEAIARYKQLHDEGKEVGILFKVK